MILSNFKNCITCVLSISFLITVATVVSATMPCTPHCIHQKNSHNISLNTHLSSQNSSVASQDIDKHNTCNNCANMYDTVFTVISFLEPKNIEPVYIYFKAYLPITPNYNFLPEPYRTPPA